MLQRMSAVLVVSVVSAVPAAAQAPAIEHQPLACVVAGRFPRLEARFAPAESVARARVQFQAEGTRHWYGVAMTRAGAGFSAILPQPKKSLKSYRYYLEVTDTSLGSSRTPEYTTVVGAGVGTCADVKTAGGLASAAVRLEVPAGAPSVPGGFSASGVMAVGAAGAAVVAGTTAATAGAATGAAAAGGGVSTAVLVVGGVAVVGAGAAVAVTAGGGEGGSTTYEGAFAGQYVVTQRITDTGGVGFDSSTTCFHTRAFSGTMKVTLEQSGGTSTGQAQTTATETSIGVTGGPTCEIGGPGNPMDFTCSVTGTPGNLACSEQSTSTFGGRTSTATHAFSGALNGGVISGMVTFAFTGQGSNPGTSVTDSASTTYPVTLR